MLTRRDFLKSAAMAAVGMTLSTVVPAQELDTLFGYPIEYVDASPLDENKIVLGDAYQVLCDAIQKLLPEASKIAWGHDWESEGDLIRAVFYSTELEERCVTLFWLSDGAVEGVDAGILAPYIAGEFRGAFQDAERARLAKGDYVIQA